MRPLRFVLILDAAVLFLLGGAFVAAPKQVIQSFQFAPFPEGVDYILGIWGCALFTMGIGYVAAAQNPIRHAVWVQVGIARGILEVVFGAIAVGRGIVTFQQAGFGIVAAGVIAVAYCVFYPRDEPSPADPLSQEQERGRRDSLEEAS